MADRQIPRGCVVYRVQTSAQGEVTGTDSCMATLPPALVVGAMHAVNVGLLQRLLLAISVQQAERVGERLHHSDWVITTDPEVVETVGRCAHRACAKCRADVDQVLAMLRDHPTRPILAGVLYWAGPADG